MAPSHYLNQWWNIVNWTLGNKFQWNLNQNWIVFIQENACETLVWKMVSILSRPQCVHSSLIENYFLGCDCWEIIIGLDNGLAPNRRQAIIWPNDDPVQWHIYAALAGDELISLLLWWCLKNVGFILLVTKASVMVACMGDHLDVNS